MLQWPGISWLLFHIPVINFLFKCTSDKMNGQAMVMNHWNYCIPFHHFAQFDRGRSDGSWNTAQKHTRTLKYHTKLYHVIAYIFNSYYNLIAWVNYACFNIASVFISYYNLLAWIKNAWSIMIRWINIWSNRVSYEYLCRVSKHTSQWSNFLPSELNVKKQ